MNPTKWIRSCAILAVLIASLVSAADDHSDALPGASIKLEGKLFCVGASITAGEGVTAQQCYVGLLAARVAENHLNLQVTRDGRSGWATGTFIGHAAEVVKAMPADATIVTIELGTNDAHNDEPPEQIAAAAARNLDKLIDLYRAKAPHAEFVIVAPTSVFPDRLSPRLIKAHYNQQTPIAMKQIRDAYEKLAHDRGLRFIDLTSVVSPVNTIDGVHPNVAGHRQMADALWESLTKGAPSTQAVGN